MGEISLTEKVRIAGLAHSKLRNAVGLVGIEADPIRQEITTKLAKHWDRKQLNDIPSDIANLWDKAQWSQTIIDQMVGEHVIQGLRRTSGMPIRIVFQKKKVLDPGEIRRVKTVDITEMTQYMLQLKLAHKIKWPSGIKHEITEDMKSLIQQVALYSEHSTEQGQVSYYAPGDELDNLIKALILACFAARPFLQDAVEAVGGPLHRGHVRQVMDPSMIFDQISGHRDITNRPFRRNQL